MAGNVLVGGELNGDGRTDILCQQSDGILCFRYNSLIFKDGEFSSGNVRVSIKNTRKLKMPFLYTKDWARFNSNSFIGKVFLRFFFANFCVLIQKKSPHERDR